MSQHIDQNRPLEETYVHPKKFIVWLFMASIFMMFAALMSAYIVRKGEGNWLEFDLPNAFITSTLLVLGSSLTYHLAYLYARKDKNQNVTLLLFASIVLGIGFLVSQYGAWSDLYGRKLLNGFGIVFGGSYSNPSGSFLYVLTGLHGFHIISGLIFLFIVTGMAKNGKIHAKSLLWIEACGTYWHFLTGLWVCLYIFLIVNH